MLDLSDVWGREEPARALFLTISHGNCLVWPETAAMHVTKLLILNKYAQLS